MSKRERVKVVNPHTGRVIHFSQKQAAIAVQQGAHVLEETDRQYTLIQICPDWRKAKPSGTSSCVLGWFLAGELRENKPWAQVVFADKRNRHLAVDADELWA